MALKNKISCDFFLFKLYFSLHIIPLDPDPKHCLKIKCDHYTVSNFIPNTLWPWFSENPIALTLIFSIHNSVHEVYFVLHCKYDQVYDICFQASIYDLCEQKSVIFMTVACYKTTQKELQMYKY